MHPVYSLLFHLPPWVWDSPVEVFNDVICLKYTPPVEDAFNFFKFFLAESVLISNGVADKFLLRLVYVHNETEIQQKVSAGGRRYLTFFYCMWQK